MKASDRLMELPACFALLLFTTSAQAEWTALKAANGMTIPHPQARETVEVKAGARTLKIPAGMVCSPARSFMAGNAYEWTCMLITASKGAERGKMVNEVRGGSWYSTGRSGVPVATGEGRSAHGGYHSVGFCIAMNLPTPK